MDERLVNVVHMEIAIDNRVGAARLRQVLRGMGERDGYRQAAIIAEARSRMKSGRMPNTDNRRASMRMWL